MPHPGRSQLRLPEHRLLNRSPDVNLAATAPLLCAGITTFSPMQHWRMQPGQRVGIIGLDGLGHVAVKFAASRGADVTIFTTTPGKIADAKRLGAREAVLWVIDYGDGPSDLFTGQRRQVWTTSIIELLK